MATPPIYYQDESVTLYHGDCREVLPVPAGRALLSGEGRTLADLIVTDPPYAETSLVWDQWPDGWVEAVTRAASSMWCFGSMRMFLDRRDQFSGWKLSQDVIWEKHNGSGFASDRFKRVHEIATHWYRGDWRDVHHVTPRVVGGSGNKSVRKRGLTPHTGAIGNTGYEDDGLRLVRSVIYGASMQQKATHPTEKPVGILEPLITYGCPDGGTVLDPFAGSGSTLVAAKQLGRKAIGVELDEHYCEIAARRLSQDVLDFGGVA